LPDPAWRASRRCDWHFSRPNSHPTIRDYFISASQNLPRQPPVSLFEELDDLQLLFGRSFEEFFSRMRGAEIGIHHHIAGAYLLRYAQERSWRGDNRRLSNGEQVNRFAALSLKRGKSVDFGGYWQRHSKDVHA
jgi:hypothetical protein